MDHAPVQPGGYDPRPWEKVRPRRDPAAIGPQGKLVLCFLLMTSAALGASCWVFATNSREQLAQITGEQARHTSSMLALACVDEFSAGDVRSLQQLAQDLIRSRNILFVAFLNPSAKPVVLASRDLDFRLERFEFSAQETRELMQVRRMRSPVFGEYVEVVAPILVKSSFPTDEVAHATPRGPTLQGYVAVGVSQVGELNQLNHINHMVMGIGCVAVIVSIPLTYLLVHRIFTPIHELLTVSRKITAGDLDARVSIQRQDVIGELARSFNEMVIWVKQQQQDIEAVNRQLAEANRDLEAKVEQRTEQVESTLQRLRAEMLEKEEFLRTVSHDLNAPLRNISGMATMLLMKNKDKFDEDVIHRLERIKKNVDVETDLIAELLELSRIKTRRQKMELLDIEHLIWELRGLFENDLKSKAIDLVLDTSLPMLHAERLRVRQVFQNLIDNAIKYMGNGMERQIHIGCVLRTGEAEFYVRDTGIGIDEEDVQKVFFVFRRGKNTATQSIAGKGVGLASVKSIIETYSGRIWVQSKVGAGATFRFTVDGKYVPVISGEPVAAEEPGQAGQELVAAG
jgi:signal transduction histidine kinase